MIYRIVRCPNCSLFQVTGAAKSLKCLRCQKSKTISHLKIYHTTNNNSEAAKVLQKLKEYSAKSKENFSDEFKSVI